MTDSTISLLELQAEFQHHVLDGQVEISGPLAAQIRPGGSAGIDVARRLHIYHHA